MSTLSPVSIKTIVVGTVERYNDNELQNTEKKMAGMRPTLVRRQIFANGMGERTRVSGTRSDKSDKAVGEPWRRFDCH